MQDYNVKYVPPEPSATGWPKRQPALSALLDAMLTDLQPRMTEFDAIVVPGDHHGIAVGAALAATMWKPLVIVCVSAHKDDVVSHITTIGDFHPGMRTLYVDDYSTYGASLPHTFAYMCQGPRTPNIIGIYEASVRTYTAVTPDEVHAIAARYLARFAPQSATVPQYVPGGGWNGPTLAAGA